MKSRFRLLVALGLVVVLATFMLYTTLAGSASSLAHIRADELLDKRSLAAKETVQLEGIIDGPIQGEIGESVRFGVATNDGKRVANVTYTGTVPDAFQVGRTMVVQGKLTGSGDDLTFVGKPGTMVTKCPSRFEAKSSESKGDT